MREFGVRVGGVRLGFFFSRVERVETCRGRELEYRSNRQIAVIGGWEMFPGLQSRFRNGGWRMWEVHKTSIATTSVDMRMISTKYINRCS